MSPGASAPRGFRGIRLWPALLVVVAWGIWTVVCWTAPEHPRQWRVMRTGVGVLVAGALLGVWWVLLSRLSWRARARGVVAGLGVGLAAVALFRFKGVSGDLVPLFEPRWRGGAGAFAPTEGGRPGETPASVPAPRTEAKGGSGVGVTPASRTGPSFPQFLGPHRDGVITGVRLARDWSAEPPRVVWRRRVGDGWGGFAVAGSWAVTQEQDGPRETVTAYDVETGERRWVHATEARYDNPLGGIGPRATPAVAGDRVFAMGALGDLVCLELETGRPVWSTNVVGGAGLKELEWGVSSSPLVVGDRVIVAPKGRRGVSLLALAVSDGRLIWTGGTADPHYSSARLEVLHGVPQILIFNGAVAAHDPETGALLWRHPWRGGHPHVSDPRVVGPDRVLVSSGYGTGSQLVRTERQPDGTWKEPEVVWRSMRLKSKFANLILRDGFVYGLDDGRLVCLDLADGTERWEGDRYGHGQLLRVEDLLLVTAESGHLVLVEAEPGAFRELGRFAAVEGKTWNPPAMAGDLVLVRNDREAAACRLPLRP